MHYILFLSLHGFYNRALPASEKPRVIHRDKYVLDANDSALRAGVHRGMALAEAKAILHGAEFLGWSAEKFADAADVWYQSLLEYVDVLEPIDQHQVALDLTGHPDPVAVASLIIDSLGVPLAAGMGASKWIAKAAASHVGSTPLRAPGGSSRRSGNSDVESTTIGVPTPAKTSRRPQGIQDVLTPNFVVKPHHALRPLSVRHLPIENEEALRLEFLGYKTIGEVQKLDEQLLRSQFGARGSTLLRAACGGERDLVEATYPAASVASRMCFADPIEDRDQLDHAFVEISQKIGSNLIEKDLSGQEMTCMLVYETYPRETMKRSFAKRMRTPLSIVSALRLLVDPKPGLIELRVRLDRLSRGFARQTSFPRIGTGGDSPAMNDSLDRVRSTFGERAIQRGSEVAEPRRKRVLRAWRDATGWM